MKTDLQKKFKGLSVLVTGATGFIGFNLVQWLAVAGARIHILTRKKSDSGTIEELKKIGKTAQSLIFHSVELTDFDLVKKAVKKAKPAKVFHLAAKTDTKLSYQAARECFETNILGIHALLESLAGQPVDSFVFASTDDVYGGGTNALVNEEWKLAPSSLYGVSKVAAEYVCKYFFEKRGVPTTILRISMCYGPHQKNTKLIPSIFLAGLKHQKGELNLSFRKKGLNPLFVEDAVEGLLRAATVSKATGEIINLAGEEMISLGKLVQKISFITKTDLKINWVGGSNREKIGNFKKIDISKAKRILNWEPRILLKDGLLKTFEYLKEISS